VILFFAGIFNKLLGSIIEFNDLIVQLEEGLPFPTVDEFRLFLNESSTPIGDSYYKLHMRLQILQDKFPTLSDFSEYQKIFYDFYRVRIIRYSYFRQYEDLDFFLRISLKLAQNPRASSNRAPKFDEASPYKLHISLSKESYAEHCNEVLTIVLKHLYLDTFSTFKCTDVDVLENLLISESVRLTQLQDEKQKSQCAASLRLIKRFLNGDQFTIYLSEGFSKFAVLRLCQDINDYLKQVRATPGERQYVNPGISPFISLRQEYLMCDFDMFNRLGYMDVTKRIESLYEKPSDLFRREKVREEVVGSSLYKFLREYQSKSFLHFKSAPKIVAQPKPDAGYKNQHLLATKQFQVS